MNKELSIRTLLFSTGLSNLETRAISGDRLETIKQDIHLMQADEKVFFTLSCKIFKVDTASGIISELEKT